MNTKVLSCWVLVGFTVVYHTNGMPWQSKRELSPQHIVYALPCPIVGPRGPTTHVPLLDCAPKQVYRGVEYALHIVMYIYT